MKTLQGLNIIELRCSTSNGLPYTDGSGAPAVVTVNLQGVTLRYALDFINSKVVLTLLSNRAGITKLGYRRAAALASESYLTWLKTQVDSTWFEANKTMYAESKDFT